MEYVYHVCCYRIYIKSLENNALSKCQKMLKPYDATNVGISDAIPFLFLLLCYVTGFGQQFIEIQHEQ